ncbi:MAG: TonB-dependent receptor, partial [Bacteroides sp.]
VSGKVIEEDTKEPVEMGAVQLLSLPDSNQMAGVVTNKQGAFTLPKVKAGKYILKISFIGFHTKMLPLQLANNVPAKNVGTLALKTDAVMLSEAVITAEAPPVTVKADTTEYAASAYRVAEGAMLEDLVKKIPGAEVDKDGKITLNGKQIKKIMVDGKEFFSDDPKVSMKNLPANMVEKVKAYDKKSDMARITGIDDGDDESVLDLTVKKGMKKGWLGNLIAGYGTKDRYEAGVMLNRFKDDASFSIIGSSNNTNNQGFSEFGDAGQGLGGGNAGAGITTSHSLGLNFAKQTKKLEVGGNVQYGYSDNDARRKSSTETFLGDNQSTYSDSQNDSRRKRHDVRADFRMEWRPDTLTTIIFRPSANYSKTESMNGSLSDTWNNSRTLINSRRSTSLSNNDNYSINGRLQMFRRLNNKGRNLFVGGSFGYSDSNGDSYSGSHTKFAELDSISDIARYSNRIGDSRNWSVSASYTEPVFKNHFLQLRYEFSHQKQMSQSLVYDSIQYTLNYAGETYELAGYPYPQYLERGYVDSLSSRVENFYDTHSVDLSLRGIYTKMMYSFGVGLTPQSSLSKSPIGPNSGKLPLKQDVLNWAPSVMFRYMFTKQHTLMFRYRGRSNTPNIEDLQEVIDVTDPMNLRYGNPDLKPSFNNNFMLFYNKFVPESMRSYSMNFFYANTINSVANRMTYNQTTGARTYQKVNVNGNWNTRGYFSFNTPFKNKKFTLSANTNASYSDAVSYTSVGKNKTDEQELSTTHNLALGERVTGSYRTDEFDVSLNGSFNYNLARNNKQENSNRQTFDYYVGGSTNVNLPYRFFISTDINCRFKEGYTGGFSKNEYIWNAQLSKNIFKNSAGTIRIKIYDILRQQTNLTRSITETQMSDTQYNTLGSYVMAHFVYRFNTLGGKAPARRNSGSGGFGGGGGHRGGMSGIRLH